MAKGSRGGQGRGPKGGINPGDIISTGDLISRRERQQSEVDQTLSVFKDVYDKYGVAVEQIQVAKLKPKANAIAYFDGANIAVNETYFDTQKIETAYDNSVQAKFHPGKGDKTAMQAVIAHELGHKLTATIGDNMGKDGWGDFNTTAKTIVEEARKLTPHRGVVQMAKNISGYATSSNAEAIAEAYADVYCNAGKAKAESKAIVSVMRKYL